MGCYWFYDTNIGKAHVKHVFLGGLYNLCLGAHCHRGWELLSSLLCPSHCNCLDPVLLGTQRGVFLSSISLSLLLIWRQSSRFVGDLGEQLAFVGSTFLLSAAVDRL